MPPSIPLATYRLQLTKNFTFDNAAATVPYLKALGISHVYASPFLKARAGSTHGYDIVDHNELNPELGGEEGFARLSQALRDADMGLILDFVPNHMGVGLADNAWWLDVLEWGPRSPYARFFDIAWDQLPFTPGGGVLLPILGKLYGDALEAGDIQLRFDDAEGSFSFWYFDHRLPVNPARYPEILRTIAARQDDETAERLTGIARRYTGANAPSLRNVKALKQELADAQVADICADGLVAYDGKDTGGRQTLHRLLERQHYRLAYWRVAASEINYRRFFDVNDLAGLRMEHAPVFTSVHRLIVRLIADGHLHGLRLDHIDGLRDPAQYTDRLQRLIRRARGNRRPTQPFYVLIEKILGEDEPLPALPGVAGTTGYEWLNAITRLLVAPRGAGTLAATARSMTGEENDLADVLWTSKETIIDTVLASEFTVLVRMLARIAAGHWASRDFTQERLGAALRRFVLNFPVYRTYITAERIDPRDRAMIVETIAKARAGGSEPDQRVFDFLAELITLDLIGPERRGYSGARALTFALKLQQFTGPLMAKSLEDTAFYRHIPLLALNEVGGWPTVPDNAAEALHAALLSRTADSPHGLTATATHDTKRGEDARTRLAALSELADEWHALLTDWRDRGEENAAFAAAPSPTHRYLLQQSIIGAWPNETIDASFRDRVTAYAIKASREGKQRTSWLAPDADYERSLTDYVGFLLDPARSSFIAMFGDFAKRLSLLGALNSLTQVTLKTLMPGVPDFYQGTELWDTSFVDPDNRRPVDFPARAQILSSDADWAHAIDHWTDGSLKIHLTARLLDFRKQRAAVFQQGSYRPLEITGKDASNVFAFERAFNGPLAIVAVLRHPATLTDQGRRWPDLTRLDAALDLGERRFLSVLAPEPGPVLTGRVSIGALMGRLPVAVAEA